MTPAEALREAMSKRKITASKIANLLNFTTRSGFTNKLYNKKGMTFLLYAQCCDVLEFDIVLRDRLTGLEIVIDDYDIGDKGEGYGYIKRDRKGNLVAPGRRPKNDSVSGVGQGEEAARSGL